MDKYFQIHRIVSDVKLTIALLFTEIPPFPLIKPNSSLVEFALFWDVRFCGLLTV
jgi:hypothetical protein